MKSFWSKARTIACGAAIAGCATQSPEVRLSADPGGMAALAGRWEGEYGSRETGRSGSIVFTLVGGESHAHGDVVMVPRGADRPLEPAHTEGAPGPMPPPVQVITIDFVRVTGNRVSGTLSPYRDPETGVGLSTTFEGEVKKNVLEGTFVTYPTGSTERHKGTWKITKKSS